ncbi:hypothetical protein [Chitinivorax sp. B]|uniref:hypothetical protein n=1 Tax=Chitinivorax sp. B TaxID=2502235 RepID=UPI0010F8CA25|nr:hypothetical protein [Chitinivorax sp. B]
MKRLALLITLLAVPMTTVMANDGLMRNQLAHEQARTEWTNAKRKLDEAVNAEKQAQFRLAESQRLVDAAIQQAEAARQALATAQARLDEAQSKVDAAWQAGNGR